jgi:hypothetical protein
MTDPGFMFVRCVLIADMKRDADIAVEFLTVFISPCLV